jgi:hypothetical protein
MTKGSPVSIIPGFEDLKPKDVLVFNANGTVMLEVNGKIELYQMQISPTGNFTSRPIERDKPLDQPQQRRHKWAVRDGCLPRLSDRGRSAGSHHRPGDHLGPASVGL